MQVYHFAADADLTTRWKGVLSVPVHPCDRLEAVADYPVGTVLIVPWGRLSAEQRQQLLDHDGPCAILVLVEHPTAAEGEVLLSQGISGYANTYIQPDLLPEVLATLARGDIWTGPELMQTMLKRLLARQAPILDPAAEWQLSAREHQVLDQLLQGQSNKQIARQLDITERTVKAHVSAILEKAGVHDRIELILLLSGQAPSNTQKYAGAGI